MPDLIAKFLETIGILFNPFVGVLMAVSFAVGVALRHRILFTFRLILCGLVVLLFYLWMQYFVFSYPPNALSVEWMISGVEYTSAGTVLANNSKFDDYSRPRLNSELVYASGGDPENIWTGRSIYIATLLGQTAGILLAFSIGTLPALESESKKG